MKNNRQISSSEPTNYKSSGVDINTGNLFVKNIAPLAKSTERLGVMKGLGSFGGLFDLKAAGYTDPILVAATDGVGTKLKIAIETGNLSTVGIDLVAMCVNDLICQGAEPLFFLDYFATSKLKITEATSIVKGITNGCRLANTALIGGETAEMPGLYAKNDFDLAGFAIGAFNRGNELPKEINVGDILISLQSSGLHSNGFSLVRAIVRSRGLSWDSEVPFSDHNLGFEVLRPTQIYTQQIGALIEKSLVQGIAHITGGGLTENIPRILNKDLGVKIKLNDIKLPQVFKWLFSTSKIKQDEALKTFNCGVGMVLIVKKNNVEETQSILKLLKQKNNIIGEITSEPGVRYSGNLVL